MSGLVDFLEHNVEDYLFNDLERMAEAKAAFPMTMSTLSGIELLGTLLSTWQFSQYRGADCFQLYWTGVLYPHDAQKAGTGEAVYKLVRHGLAHVFAPKGPITVSLNRTNHLSFTSLGVNIDARQLADDLMASYRKTVKPIAADASTALGATAVTMNKQLVDMAACYEREAQKYLHPSVFAPETTVAVSSKVSSAMRP